MPFTQVPALPKDENNNDKLPTVRIFMTGQLMLQPNANSDACEVFVNRSAPNHHLTVEVREKRPGRPDLLLMRHHGPLEFRDPNNPVDGLIIKRLQGGSVGMYTGAPSDFGEALTSAIDLRSEDFHPANEMAIDFECARPSIMIKDGIFHTAFKISPQKVAVTLKRGAESRLLQPFASLIGANIYLNEGERLLLNWREMGLAKTLSLTKPQDTEVTYEVYVINDPLYEDDEEPKAHDELGEFYKVLPTVPTEDRFKMEVEFLAPVAHDKGTTKTPCMPVVVSGP